jgi:hypothetical protein
LVSLAALGMDGVPALDPLSYPGRVIDGPALLSGPQLLEVVPTADHMGRWLLPEDATVDEALADIGRAPTGQRFPVIAIGSNAAPGQLHYKLDQLGLSQVVPMTPVRVSGLGVGVSAHVGLKGYVANSPFADPDGEAEAVLTLLDAEQLRAIDATELPRYHRALLPGAKFPMTLPSGERLDAAYLYVNAAGVLAGVDGRPRAPGVQAALLTELLERSSRLRGLFGSPQEWVTKARADPELRAAAKRIFRELGWVLPQDALLRTICDPASPPLGYAEVSPLASIRTAP